MGDIDATLVDSWVGTLDENSRAQLFAFDPGRKAILLIAGDKSGNWDRWYRTAIPSADRLYDRHLENFQEEHHHGNKS